MNKQITLAIFTFIAYACIMAAGMYNLHYVQHSAYSSPFMPIYLFWFEVIMTVVVVLIYFTYFKKQLAYQRPKPLSLVFVLGYGIMVVNLIIMFYQVFSTGHFDPKYYKVIALITFTIVLVAISEELMFRGIILPALASKYHRIVAILLSAICFSAFHAINIIGGLPVQISIYQLQNTLLMGITFACFASEFGSVLPGILLHFLLDFNLIIGADTNTHFGYNYQFALNFNPWFGVFMIALLGYKYLRQRM